MDSEMKILINTISQVDLINKAEKAEITGTKAEKDFAATLSSPAIKDKNFMLGEWVHCDDKWVSDNAAMLALYPDIKEAHVVLQEKMVRQIEEQGLQSFAQGIKDAADTYKQELPAIADTVLKIAPVRVA
jgi:hypothetical protein